MKKLIEYVVRYEDGNVIGTIYCIDKDNMQDVVNTLEKANITYMVVKVKDADTFTLHCITNCDDLFGSK